MRIIVAFLFTLACAVAYAQTKTQTPQLQDLEKILREGETWSAKQSAIAREREGACLNAFGHRQFCECLSNELHWVISFETYVRLVSVPTGQITTTGDEKVLIESALRARELCVSKYINLK